MPKNEKSGWQYEHSPRQKGQLKGLNMAVAGWWGHGTANNNNETII